MSSRETILARIREALTMEAYPHGTAGLPTTADQRRVMPQVGATEEERLALFAKNAGDLRATFVRAESEAEAWRKLKEASVTERWSRVLTHKSALAQSGAESIGVPVAYIEQGLPKAELAQCDVGITECDALIAQTGTVLVTSRSAGGRALSCLPPHHVVVARREQLVPDLPAAFAMLKSKYARGFPSMISFITGPSRTGDIERILVLGAHGPKQLTILCIG